MHFHSVAVKDILCAIRLLAKIEVAAQAHLQDIFECSDGLICKSIDSVSDYLYNLRSLENNAYLQRLKSSQ